MLRYASHRGSGPAGTAFEGTRSAFDTPEAGRLRAVGGIVDDGQIELGFCDRFQIDVLELIDEIVNLIPRWRTRLGCLPVGSTRAERNDNNEQSPIKPVIHHKSGQFSMISITAVFLKWVCQDGTAGVDMGPLAHSMPRAQRLRCRTGKTLRSPQWRKCMSLSSYSFFRESPARRLANSSQRRLYRVRCAGVRFSTT